MRSTGAFRFSRKTSLDRFELIRVHWRFRFNLVTLAGEILVQTVRNLWANKLRSLLTMFGISWGIAAIIFMIAIGEGFKAGYRNMLYTMGTDIVIFWSGRTSLQAGGQRAGRDIRL